MGTATVQPHDNIRDVLRAHPASREILDRYGLMGCGGEAGPDERLDFFAQAHHVALAQLIRDLNQAIANGSAPKRPTSSPPEPERADRYKPFLYASVALTLTFGATLGMINLARLTWTLGFLSLPSVWAHAYVQVFGFVGLFVMGVACHVIPRFGGTTLQAPRHATWALRVQVAGVLLVACGFFHAPLTRPLWIAGTSLLTIGALLFAATITRTIRASQPSPEPYAPWVLAGTLWLVAGSMLTLVAALGGDPTWHFVIWQAALFGFAGSWIFGVGRRIFPVFLGWRPAHRRAERPMFVLYQIAVACWSAGAWPGEQTTFVVLRAVGAAALIVAVVGYSHVLGAWRMRSMRAAGQDLSPRRFVTAGWVWLIAGLAAGPVWTLGALAHGSYGSPVMLDFARHAIAFGFITQVMMGVAVRVLPVFSGNRLWSPRARDASFYLINIAIAVRALEAVVAMGFVPGAWSYIALSGPIAVAAVVLFAANVVFTISGRPERTSSAQRRAAEPGTAIPDMRVSDVLELPGALDVLIAAGFTPLANPALRMTVARTVTLRQACWMMNVDLGAVTAAVTAQPRSTQQKILPLVVVQPGRVRE